MLPLVDILALFRWWLALMVVGAIATPLAWWFFGGSDGFGRLPSLGYAFAKPLGLLLVSYIFWILGSLGFLANTTGGILLALIVVVALSVLAQRQRAHSISETVKQNWQLILITELLFAALLIFWAWARAQNPAILNTEKPMEFAFLNAVTRSDSFPPLDPWLSGFAISYYYFGYVMMSVLARLSAVQNAIAFNLATAWLYAATSLGAFSLVYDLVTLQARQRQQQARTMAVTLGILGALAVGLAGNLEIVLEVLHHNGVGSAELWANIGIKDIDGPPGNGEGTARYETANWWWWRSSRLINEHNLAGTTDGVIEPIAEFPSFSFALGDVHPHVLALPYAFLSMAVALIWYLSRNRLSISGSTTTFRDRITDYRLPITTHWPHFLLTALIIGGLSFLNTWDVLIYIWLLIAGIALATWRQQGKWSGQIVHTAIFWAIAFVVVAYIAYLPFYIGFSSQAGAPFILPMLMRPTRLVHFLGIFGMPLLAITVFMLVMVVQQRGRQWKSGAAVASGLFVTLLLLMLLMGFLIAMSPAGHGPISSLAQQLELNLPPRIVGDSAATQLGWAAQAIARLLPTILSARLAYIWVSLLLLFLIGGCVMLAKEQFETDGVNSAENAHPPQTLPFVLLLILTGALLTLGPEYVYLKDNFSQRINTIFKFYYQAWAMFGVAAVVSLYILSQRTRIVGLVTAAGYLALFGGAMMFPFYMIQWGAAWHGQEPTLNGLTFVQNNNINEYDAIMWLQENVDGAPVVLEATGGAYSEYARISARTGLPTVLGWANHERQWRGATPEPDERDPIIRTIYSQPDWHGIPELLDRYNVTYIYVGHIERDSYGLGGLDKFDQNLEVAFQNDSVTIYAYRPRGG